MTQREQLEQPAIPTPEHPADPLPEPRCGAMTRAGQPCRNRPLEGQRYCRLHAPLAGANSAVPAEAVELDGGSDPEELPLGNLPLEDAARAEVVAALEELEIEIRNQPSDRDGPRDLAADALRLVRENLLRAGPLAIEQVLKLVRENLNLNSDYLDPDFWRGLGMVLRYQAEETADMLRRRVRGEYATDRYGMDMELIELVRPFLSFMYRRWWRVSAEGLEHVPDDTRALMVANHSGVLPWDGAMIATAVLDEHDSPRVVRCLHLSWFSMLPFVAPALAAFGQVQALPENAIRLLDEDQLVCVFPEGLKGVGKLFKDRYKLARFGRGGFVQMALRTGAPLIPVAVIGAEETYPMLANVKPAAQLFGMPYFPLTPLFPWFGLLGVVPLPSKWTIVFHAPIPTAQYGPSGADDPLLVSELSERVRGRIQATIDEKLGVRKSVFFG
ncbi:MAG TPA: lysophospholipid acyltransferase family protein [Roseiflexaceae bacterium]